MASINDKITETFNGQNPTSTTVSAPRSVGGSSISCNSLAGWPTNTAVHFATYQIDTTSKKIAGSQVDWKGIVSGSSIGTLTRQGGVADAGNSIGDIVEMMPTYSWANDLAKGLENTLNSDGTLKSSLTVNSPSLKSPTTDTLVVTSGTTLPNGDIVTANLANASVTADKLGTGAAAAFVATSETTPSNTYADLATVTDTVAVTIGANGVALVSIAAHVALGTASGESVFVGFAVGGATTIAATDTLAFQYQPWTAGAFGQYGNTFLVTGLAPGSTTFKMKYRVSSNTGTFFNRRIAVVPL